MTWWHRLWRPRQVEEQLERELRFHLDQHTADLIGQGHDPAAARRQARLALGGPEQVKELCRDARGTRWLGDLSQDVRYALRALLQKPGFAAVAVCTMALGSGATTVMFTLLNGVLLKPMAYAAPDRLVSLVEQTDWSTPSGNQWAFAYPNYLDCKREITSLALAAWRFGGGTVSEPGEPEYVGGRQISADLFAVLGTALVQGRAFHAEEDRPGAAPVVIISYNLWQRHYGGSPTAIGAALVFEGKPHTVVGIAPAGFQFGDADVFTPIGQYTDRRMQNREAHPGIQVWARLQPGVTLERAQTELSLLGRGLAERYPKSNAGRTFVAQPLGPNVGSVRSTLWLLLGAVSLVLLIAVANVASLLLARAVSRERELGLRAALGAARGRLIRQCLTESLVLGLFGGVLGVVIAAIGVRPFVLFWPGGLPRAAEVHLDGRVLLFAMAISLASGLLFGLAPALRAPARNLEYTLRAGARGVAGSSRRLHAAFVISEIALAVVLLVSAGMLGRTILRLSSVDPGVDVRNVLVARIALSPATLAAPARIRAAWDDVLDRARRVPGVQSIAMVDTVPMRAGNNQLAYSTTAVAPPPNQQPVALATSVTPDYLEVMGVPLRRGRFFSDQDRMGTRAVIVIDDVLAQHAFGGQDPVGKRLWIPAMGPGPVDVVGVVGHVRHWGPASDDQAQVRAQFYYPMAQVPDALLRRWSELTSIAVRTSIAPLSVVESLRQALRGATGDQVLYEVRTMEQLASGTLDRQRLLLLLFGIFAGLAMLLACIGVYGVLAYLTSQRVPEIGVRMALGATAGDVMRLVLGQSLGMILVGVGVGAGGSWAAGRLLQRLVDGVRPTEPSTFAVMVLVLVVAALFAGFLPARRASRLDALTALRQD
jgi:predicted permease